MLSASTTWSIGKSGRRGGPDLPASDQSHHAAPDPSNLRRTGSITIRGRISLILSGMLATLLVIGALWWGHGTRQAVHEEVEAATRVAEQWLTMLILETLDDEVAGVPRLLSHLEALGRLRANRLEVRGSNGTLLYASPEPTYKAGRDAPAWFSRQISPIVATRGFFAGEHFILLIPDTSRAVLDAWDDLKAMLGWTAASFLLLWLGTRNAIARALAPLTQIDAALDRAANGHFDTRLALSGFAEIDRLATTYNRLADNLNDSIIENVRLEQDRDTVLAIKGRLAHQRKVIARELHDELGQSITAVRAIAGAIQQRSSGHPEIHGSAQAVIAMTTQMQEGVRKIVTSLRDNDDPHNTVGICSVIRDYSALWANYHPDIELILESTATDHIVSEELGHTTLRVLQESLTNIARHAGARNVWITLTIDGGAIHLRVSDDGLGLPDRLGEDRFGIQGMRERVALHRGSFKIESPTGGGVIIEIRLPLDHSPKGLEHV